MMSFTINFKPKDPITLQAGGTAQLLVLALPSDHPDFPKHIRFLSLLCSQINQISGMNSEAGEQDVNSDGATGNHHCWQCNNLSTTHISNGMKPIVRGFLSDFEASARRGCEICLLLLTAISPYQGPGRLKAYIRPGAALNILVKCANKNARYDLFTPIGRFQPISFLTEVVNLKRHLQSSEAEAMIQVSRFRLGQGLVRHGSSPSRIPQTIGWLTYCNRGSRIAKPMKFAKAQIYRTYRQRGSSM